MKFFQPGIRDEWHFVIGKGAGDQQAFYKELERQLAPNIEALKVKSGYMKVGNFFNKKTMHFMKYGKYYSLTCAEAFGTELNISWYLYFSGAAVDRKSVV